MNPDKIDIACQMVVKASETTQQEIVKDLMKPDPSPEEAKRILGENQEGGENKDGTSPS